MRNSLARRIADGWRSHGPDALFVVMAAFFLVEFLSAALARYNTFGVWSYDFAVFDQTIWNSAHGALFQNTVVPDAHILLGQRFSPILLVLTPLYALQDQRILAVIPPLAVVVAAFPFYWFAKRRIGAALACIIGLAYFLAPGVQLLGTRQFYEPYLALVFLSFATLFLLRRRYLPMLACLALTLICKEEMGVVLAGFGLYLLVVQRKYWPGLALIVFGLAWTAVLVDRVIPYFSGQGQYYYFGGSDVDGKDHYDYLGNNVFDIAKTTLTQPWLAAQHVLVPRKTQVLQQLFQSLGYLPLLGIETTALAGPTLAYTLLSDGLSQGGLNSYHLAPVYPFLFFGMIVGIERLLRWRWSRLPTVAWRRVAIGVFLLLAAVVNYWNVSPRAIPDNWAFGFAPIPAHDQLGAALAEQIPSSAAVMAQEELLSHLTQRSEIYFLLGMTCNAMADYTFVDMTRAWYGYHRYGWDRLLALPFFKTVVERDGYILKVNRPFEQPAQQVDAHVADKIKILGYDLADASVTGGDKIWPVLSWRAAPNAGPYVIRLDVVDAPGHVWAERKRAPCLKTRAGEAPRELFNEDFELRLPPTMPAGPYMLTVAFMDGKGESEFPLRKDEGRELAPEFTLGTFDVLKNHASVPAAQLYGIERRIYFDMAEMRLLGHTPPREEIKPGELLQIGLYWRAREKPRGDYVAAVQLRDATGQVAFEQSSRPAKDTYPTTGWSSGEVLLDWHDFNLPLDLAAGAYQIAVVLRNSADQQTLGEAVLTEISVLQ